MNWCASLLSQGLRAPTDLGLLRTSCLLCCVFGCVVLAIVGVVALNRWIDRRTEAKKDQSAQDKT